MIYQNLGGSICDITIDFSVTASRSVVRFCFQNLSVDPVSCTIGFTTVICFGDHSFLRHTQ